MLIYLPVETSRREMIAKVFTATMLASKGYPVALFKSNFFEEIGWPSPGLYIGRNCFRHAGFSQERHYDRLKDSGIRVWHLDEEGGVYAGQSEREWRKSLLRRLNPSILREDDKILTWGQWQKQAFLDLDPDCPVCVTGSPNFDILRPAYFRALSEFDERETDGRSNFILVNTRCSLSNGLISIQRHLEADSPVSLHVDPRPLRHRISQNGILQFAFISLVQNLAERLPEEEIVLRPHPAEDPTVYRDLLSGFPNVSVEWRGDVGSWIRRCRVLIQNGCTTAVQALVAEKPVITYLPIDEVNDLSPGLPNLVGVPCKDLNAVIEALERNATVQGDETLNRSIAMTEANKKIVEMVEQECRPPSGVDKLDEIAKKIEKSARHATSRDARKRFKRRILPLRKKLNKNKGKKFDVDFFSRAVDVCSAAQRHLEKEVDFLAPHAECCLVLPNRSNGPPRAQDHKVAVR